MAQDIPGASGRVIGKSFAKLQDRVAVLGHVKTPHFHSVTGSLVFATFSATGQLIRVLTGPLEAQVVSVEKCGGDALCAAHREKSLRHQNIKGKWREKTALEQASSLWDRTTLFWHLIT